MQKILNLKNIVYLTMTGVTLFAIGSIFDYQARKVEAQAQCVEPGTFFPGGSYCILASLPQSLANAANPAPPASNPFIWSWVDNNSTPLPLAGTSSGACPQGFTSGSFMINTEEGHHPEYTNNSSNVQNHDYFQGFVGRSGEGPGSHKILLHLCCK